MQGGRSMQPDGSSKSANQRTRLTLQPVGGSSVSALFLFAADGFFSPEGGFFFFFSATGSFFCSTNSSSTSASVSFIAAALMRAPPGIAACHGATRSGGCSYMLFGGFCSASVRTASATFSRHKICVAGARQLVSGRQVQSSSELSAENQGQVARDQLGVSLPAWPSNCLKKNTAK
jgi:hypothetical protein